MEVFAEIDIVGKLECEIKMTPATVGLATSSELVIGKHQKSYVRKGSMIMPTGAPQIPSIHINTVEKGYITLSLEEIFLSPQEAEITVVKGKPLFQDNDPRLHSALIQDETLKVTMNSKSKFIMEQTTNGIHVIDTCLRSE